MGLAMTEQMAESLIRNATKMRMPSNNSGESLKFVKDAIEVGREIANMLSCPESYSNEKREKFTKRTFEIMQENVNK